MNPTREEFALAARFVGFGLHDVYGDMPWVYPLPLRLNSDEEPMGLRIWTPHIPSADAYGLLAKLIGAPDAMTFHEFVALGTPQREFEKAEASGNADQLAAATFNLAVAIQRDRENSND